MKIYKKLMSLSMVALASANILTYTVTAQEETGTHTVQSGEYLLAIANKYGVSVEELRAWNGLTSDWINVGDVLAVSASAAGSAATSTSSTTTTSDAAAPVTNAGTHVVAPGDTLYTIAQRYGTTVGSLMAWNGLSSDWLNVGDVLAVYGAASATDYYPSTTPTTTSGYHTVAPGDTLSGIALAYGVSVSDLLAWNGLTSDWLNVGDVLSVGGYSQTPAYTPSATPAVTPTGATYTVKSGDNLSTIAAAHGMTVDELMAMNGLSSTFLQIGDVLAVKGGSGTASSAETSSNDANTNESEKNDSSDSNSIAPTAEKDKEAGIKARHKVVAGDNLWRIANKYGVTVHNVKVWNNLTDDSVIKEGDELIIKQSGYEAKKHKVTAEDTLESLAEQYKTTPEKLTEWNELKDSKLEVDKELYVSDPKAKIHEVKNGETLEKIAEQYKVTVEELREWNDLPAATVVVNGSLVVSDPTGTKEAENATESTETTEAVETTTAAE
ncbi:LysM peptidoglycan-binding domain-containing protein [Aerococcaceae bacterium zg-BR9]|uniref:LysM peptidoglycan-binding domain-containing protein n=1 Tax=Aerococcaceae bacterium zg-1292 TaxID=2774330 RepID=UPI004063FE12|nr:LysM peptidoglycan-binding domain-containing protein [Aerococcaceae bacterium zg-BR9]